ncbi:Hemocytin, partial [Zootermopsis nevadensis]
AVCLPPCQHNGICVKPNECNCPENYAGAQCQYEKKPCLNYPTLPANSRRSCNSKTCTIMCADGHKFPDGSAIANMICRDGTWIPSQPEWKSIPDCEPVCKPPCENGGNCLSFNVCQCPQEFRGPQCQYATSVCSVEKLGFNGNYKCKGSDTSVTCNISCPSGSHFQEQPASEYVCFYSAGTFLPTPVPQCIFEAGIEMLPGNGLPGKFQYGSLNSINYQNWSNTSSWSQLLGGVLPFDIATSGRTAVSVIEQLPHPGFCYVWGQSHYKTFDGKVFSFESQCSYTVLLDKVDNTFNINLEPKATHTVIRIFAQDKEYILTLSGKLIEQSKCIQNVNVEHTVMSGIIVENEAHFIVFKLTGIGLTLKWDGQNFVGVGVTESLWNRSAGLCGLLDGRIENDFTSKDGSSAHSISSFINSWKVKALEAEQCASSPVETPACGRYNLHRDEEKHFQVENAATNFCNKLLQDPRFAACRAVVDVKPYYEACKWDYCACNQSNSKRNECACQSFAVYAKVCSQHSETTAIKNWRDDSTCPMHCTGSRVYFPCGPSSQETCRSVTSVAMTSVTQSCEEGCYCPVGTVIHDQQCVSREQCPCQLRGRMFQPGEKVIKDCNTCTCVSGQWSCTQVNCGGRCGAIGDPHYVTFDGKRFNFMGKCSYHLMKGDNYSIEAENVACAGAISEAMNFLPVSSSEYPSCTKTVTIHLDEHSIKLKQGREVLVDGQEVSKLPFTAAGAYIHVVSSIFLIVDLPNGLQIWWDGITRVYIDAPSRFQGNTKGLCGTFNQNQNDDFLTPEGDVEQDVVAFANKWKTSEVCLDVLESEASSHPCDINAHNRATAEKSCSKLKGSLFEGCHWFVDPEPYYQDCLYDLCSCQLKISQCLCPIFAAYAKECAHKEILIDWRSDIRECGIHCPGGQVYQICGNTCTRSCYDISQNPQCRRQCVEGCNCPEGQTIDPTIGECIPVGRCACQHEGVEYPANFKDVRAGNKGLELCLCRNAVWECQPATPQESEEFPKTGAMVAGCSHVENQEFTTCEPVEPVTCKNMHSPPQYSPAICRTGCKCKKGYVLDSHTRKCIKPTECPCHHGGKSYGEAETMQEDCNTCKCESGKWSCSERVCAGVCTAWGDSHYKTFDGRIYDFHGNCDYVLVKGSLGFDDIFDISIQNVPCGSSGISCSKSVSLRVGSSEKMEIITFTREKPVPSHTSLGRITIREAGLFVFAEVFDLGLVLQWDRGTRVYVRADPKWKDRLKGLCGNYNDNQLDDFQTPSGGLSEVSARLFGDSWRLQSYCAESVDIADTCLSHPNRKLWAMKKCGVLKSSVFQPCHSEVPLEPYLERCIFDACGCDLGGDCECLCTAISAYAQECNVRGASIKWRSQELCPIQCDEKCSHYSPCVQTCPKQTCDNYFIHSNLNKLCGEDACVEGCEVTPCPPGQVFNNLTSLECVPVATCKPFCMQIGDVIYYEGDIIQQDDCHKCTCSHQKKTCLGQPCTSITSTPPTTVFAATTTEMKTQIPKCTGGWTNWLSRDNPKYETGADTEPLPTVGQLVSSYEEAVCNVTEMKSIECRVVGTHQFYKDTGENVECSIMNGGLKCVGGCHNYEIRVLCKCPIHCDVNNPNSRDVKDCHRFYHCKDTLEGPELVEKTCGPFMMYNHEKQVCDWPATVIGLRPECAAITPELTTETATTPTSETTPGECKSGCVVPCSQVCVYYDFALKGSGFCTSIEDCVPGCAPANSAINCPPGFLWRDAVSCVRIADCTCRSHSGKPIKPGSVVQESECEVCQCIDNQYECDTSACNRTVATTEASPIFVTETAATQTVPAKNLENITATPTVTLKTTVTPPHPCDINRINYIIEELPDVKFSSGNTQSPHQHRLQYLTPESSDVVWKPVDNNKDQYLQVDLGTLEPLYGTVVWGNPKTDEYVTSYMVLYSDNGQRYMYVTDAEDSPMIFRGPADHKKQVVQQFFQPIEARYVRWNPLTWHNAIAMKVDLLGCGELTTEGATITSVGFTSTSYEVCRDQMGLENGMMADQQFTASSVYDKDERFGPAEARLNGDTSWVPATHNRNQWIQFDFFEPRNLTGIVTQGNENLNSWVETFTVQHSHDGKAWNPIHESTTQSEKVFLANFDSVTPHTNIFDRILHTRYLRLFPVKWHKNIALRAEVLGCFEPYPTPPTTEVSFTTSTLPQCNPCPGWHSEDPVAAELCQCPQGKFWNGESCVNRTECPCYVGYISYSVGTLYDSQDCNECICKIGGIGSCKEKICPPCDQGLQRVLTPSCGCICKPCPPSTVLCPTSNICINATSWCDGLEDCPDDERDCTTPTVPTTISTSAATIPVPACPPMICPEGFKVVLKKDTQLKNPEESSIIFKDRFKGVKGGNKGGVKTVLPKPLKLSKGNLCPDFVCVPIKECTVLKCPPNFMVHIVKEKNNVKLKCPIYTCVPPLPPRASCNITGRTFHTFDGTEFKYDVCNHILARDLQNDNWDISVYKDCPEVNVACTQHLVIIQDEHEIRLHPDLSVDFNGYKYNVEQKIGSQLKQSFTVSRMGDTLLFQSRRYGFQVMWDAKESIKLSIPGKMSGHVDGLCGFFNRNMKDDKMKPDGKLGRTTAEFADSWVNSYLEAKCKPLSCPLSLQEKALHICSLVREPLFAQCRGVVSVEKYISYCIETACSCLQAANSTEAGCRCQALLGFVTQCTAAESSVDLSSWRVQHDCPASCPPPLVFHDCFQRECEPNCNGMKDRNQCPSMPGTCIPGCFCPDGLVRKGDKCVKPIECRDCVCDGFGDPQYLTFDRSNYTFNGNCTYVAARDVNPHGKHTFQVFVTNVQCRDEPISTCTKAVLVEYEGHKIHIQRKEGDNRHELKVSVDGNLVNKFPLVNDWLQLEEVPGTEVTVLIPQIQLEVTYFFHNFAFVVRLPSHTYGHKTEGLCGNCNSGNKDDFTTRNGTVTRDIDEFGKSWLHPLPSETGCTVIPQPAECMPPPPDVDPCFKILDEERFGECYPLVDPYPYVAACQYDRCHSIDKETSSCRDLEAYTRACTEAGLCLNWRTNASCPYTCPEGM